MNALLMAGADILANPLVRSLLIFAALIVGILILFFIMSKRAGTASENDSAMNDSAKSEPIPAPVVSAAPITNDGEIIAAIMAAIVAAESETGKKFTVVSFKRK